MSDDKDQHKPCKEAEVLFIRPRGSIQCHIGGTVKPKKVCVRCAYAIDCKEYSGYFTKQNHVGKLREFYWKIRAKISAWFNYIYANVMGEY